MKTEDKAPATQGASSHNDLVLANASKLGCIVGSIALLSIAGAATIAILRILN